MTRPSLIDSARQRVLILDGAMGTTIHALDLPLADYQHLENCNEILVLTKPSAIREIHRSFLSVGCDGVLTNTFGGCKHVLAEFDLSERTEQINRAAAEIAVQACKEFESTSRPRYVIGSIGPGTRLPSLGQADWDTLLDSFSAQCRGLMAGGVDALLIETCQDILQAKVAIVAATDAMREADREVPLFCTVTIETTGTMLVGTDLAAALVTLDAYPQISGLGLNCATGPQEMGEHVRFLSKHCDRLLIVQPNAGLPQLIEGKPKYMLTPDEFTRWLLEFVEVDGVNIVGGCCGTTPAHIAALVAAIGTRPPKTRSASQDPSISSLYQAVGIRQDNAVLAIGERTNANGSKQFRELLAAGDIDGMVRLGKTKHRKERTASMYARPMSVGMKWSI